MFGFTLQEQFIACRITFDVISCSHDLELRCNDTQALFEGTHPRRFRAIGTVATRKLAMLEAAKTLDFLRSPPGNRLEALKGARAGQWSIRINDQWRVCFAWTEAGPVDIEIVDYH